RSRRDDSLSRASSSASPLSAASFDITTVNPDRTTTIHPIRGRHDGHTTIQTAPAAQSGIRTTGMCTRSGCAGSPKMVSISTDVLYPLGRLRYATVELPPAGVGWATTFTNSQP